MIIKTVCSHCNEVSYVHIAVRMNDTPTGQMLNELKVIDTLTEEDLLKLVSNFIYKNRKEGIDNYELSDVLNRCFGISPQFVPELMQKCQLENKRNKKVEQSFLKTNFLSFSASSVQ